MALHRANSAVQSSLFQDTVRSLLTWLVNILAQLSWHLRHRMQCHAFGLVYPDQPLTYYQFYNSNYMPKYPFITEGKKVGIII
jgi:hypothetical protein